MLYAQMVAVPARIGNGAVWVMDEEWRKKVVALAPGPAGMPPADLHPSGEMVLLGLPVVVIEGGGWPHLEPRTRAAQAPRRRFAPPAVRAEWWPGQAGASGGPGGGATFGAGGGGGSRPAAG